MANEPNKRKNSSHACRTFHDLLLEIPIVGKPTHNLLKRKGGIMKKLGAFTLIVLAFLVWSHYKRNDQQTTSHNKTATATGNNSPATNQSATASGSNTTVNGISDEGLKQIRDGMLAVQKQKDAELRAKFNLGYILFTATERNEIVPLDSPMDDILKVDWKSGYNVSFSDDAVSLRLPHMVFHPPNSSVIDFNGSTITVRRHFEPFARPGFVIGNYRLTFKVVSTNEDSIIIAMGIQSPPEKRPSMEELMKYDN
jgi:hypothetical protein